MTTTTTTGVKIHEQNLEKQIEKHMSGCMSGFFNIFDRSNLLSTKRLYPKRLHPPPVCDSASEPVSSAGSPALSREFEKPKMTTEQESVSMKDLTPVTVSPALKSPSPTSPWKFAREAPRLSLDSRAITDAKGGLRPREIRINNASNSRNVAGDERRSPSVIARLMGLEPLPSSVCSSSPEPEKKSVLRRSASESRSREYRFVGDTPSFLSPARNDTGEGKLDHSVVNRQQNKNGVKSVNQINNNNSKMSYNQRRLMLERKSCYDATDFFPAEIPIKQQHQAVTIYGEIERRLRTRGIDEQSKDLETLKHILEALQLKGLLHTSTDATSKPVHDRRFFNMEESPIVLMKPSIRRRNNNVSSFEPALSPKRERPTRSVARSPGRSDNNRSSSPTLRRKGGPLNPHSPVQSPRLTRRSDQTVSKSPRNRRPTAEIHRSTFPEDELSTSSFSTSSFTDNERWKIEEYKDGRNLLERCDKLLHNIAEITASSNSVELQQPSPVSVLDSSFYKEDESSPSPVKKRTIDFKDHAVIELEDGPWSPSSSTQLLKLDNEIDNSFDDPEYSYVAEVIRASIYLPDDKNLFFLLENKSSIRSIRNDKSKASTLQRKLIFDTVTEFLDRNRKLSPWKAVSNPEKRPILDQIWSEFQKIREQGPSEDLLEVICEKDLSQDSITGWTDFPTEMSEAILDIERLIFKDLINESIQDLATLARVSEKVPTLCRKLVF